MKAMISAALFLFFSQVRASDFSSIELSDWKKVVLSHDHIRFSRSSSPDYAIHLQVDSYDPKDTWDEKKFPDEIKKMEKIRSGMSFFMGIKDYKITSSKFDGRKLELEGSYVRGGNKTIVFKEINFYHKKHFLQFKLISESKLPADDEIKKIIDEIAPEKVEID